MNGLWGTLVPLIVGSAVVPVQITLTILLLRSSLATAAAFVAGMTATRLVQGVLFGLVASAVLLVVGVLFLVTALKALLGGEDEDAPPPKWMRRTASATPGRAFVLGAGYLAIAVKFWVFTLGAIGAIGDADLGPAAAIAVFVLFAVLAACVPIASVAYAALAPASSAALLERASAWLERRNRVILVVLGLVFGTWFLMKALAGLGVL